MNKLKKLVDWIINNFENKNIKIKGKIIQIIDSLHPLKNYVILL